MTFLYLNSDEMGRGEPALGKKLLKSFLTELAKSDIQIDFVGCVHSAINLTTEGSEVLESLKALEERRATIASCGTCLDHYGLRDKVIIGQIGSMDATVTMMADADRVIKPC